MMNWRPLALVTAIGAALASPAFAADGDALQSHENQLGNTTERNVVVTPTPELAAPLPNGRVEYGDGTASGTIAQPDVHAVVPSEPPVMSPNMNDESAAQESRETGKVDAPNAAPPQTGSDVQAGDMGPSNAKAQ